MEFDTEVKPVRKTKDIAARNHRICELYETGLNLEEIAKLMGITRERIRQILESQNVRRRTTKELAQSARKKFLDKHGIDIDKAFEEMRSVKAVEKKFESLHSVPAVWIRDYLEPRRNEAVYWTTASKRWSDSELIDMLKEASEGSGTLSAKKYLRWRKDHNFNGKRPPTHTAIGWRFESWRNAVEKAGLTCIEPTREYRRKWSSDDAFNAIADYVEECVALNVRPAFAGYEKWAQKDKSSRPSGAYVRFLTSMTWSQALAEVYRRQASVEG